MAAQEEQPPEPGMVRCQAPGCGQWFHKQSGRHIYCKQPGCTYRRGAPPEQELQEPEGAAVELLRRLQDPEVGEVSQDLIAARLRAFSAAVRVNDAQAVFGAAIDVAVPFVMVADRAREGRLPGRAAQVIPGAPVQRPAPSGSQPRGLVHAVLASHARTVTLSERRVEAIWAMLRAREALEGAERGVAQTAGTQQSLEAEAIRETRRREYEQAERALQVVEAAWSERREALTELEGAGASVGAPVRGSGGANGRRAAA